MAEQLVVDRPWNSENDLLTAGSNVGGAEVTKLAGLPIPTPSQGMNIGVAPVDTADVMENIFNNSYKKAVKNNTNPYASKYQETALSDRYVGRSVNYGDYKLDPKALDARYSKTQSYGEQAFNSLKVGLANGGSTFAIGMLGLPSLLSNIKNGVTGNTVEPSALEEGLFEWSRGVAKNNTTFQNEQDLKTDTWNTIKNVLLPSAISGSSGGWGKIFENVMYGVGAGASIAVQEAAVTAIAPGVGNSLVLGTSVAKILNNIGNIQKYSTLANRIVESAEVIGQIGQTLNTSNKIKNAARWAYGSTIGAHGEAAFEGIEGTHALRTSLTEKFKQQNGYPPTGKDLEGIETLAKEAGAARYWANMGLLMGSNSFQLKRLFTNIDLARDATKTLAERGLKTTVNEAGEVVARKNVQLTSDWWNRGFQSKLKPIAETVASRANTDFIKESVSEGLEEFSQGWIDKSVNNYYTWKLDHRGQPGLDQAMKSIGEGFSDSWNTEGLSSFLSGAIAGVGQQAMMTPLTAQKRIQMAKDRKTALDETLAGYNAFNPSEFLQASHAEEFVSAGNVNSVRNTVVGRAQILNANSVADEVAELAVELNDKKTYKDMEELSFFSMAEPYVSKGHAGILKEQMQFAIDNLPDDAAVAEMVGDPTMTKAKAIQQFNAKVDAANTSYSRISQAFTNPYSAYGDDQEKARYWTFEKDYMQELAYLDYRMNSLAKRKGDLQKELGPYYDDFKYFAEESTLESGRKYINNEIERIKGSEEYLKELGVADAQIGETFQREKFRLKQYEQSLSALDELIANPTMENNIDFQDKYRVAFAVKNEMQPNGLIDRDVVMSKISDMSRINNDMDTMQEMLTAYFKPQGQEIFFNAFSAASRRQGRLRTLFSKSQRFKDLFPELASTYPELDAEELAVAVEDSVTVDDARESAKVAAEEKRKKVEETARIEQLVRDKFIAANRGDEADEFINNNPVGDKNEKTYLANASDYLSSVDTTEFNDQRDALQMKFTEAVLKISPNFIEDGSRNYSENLDEYEALSPVDQLKYLKEVAKYHEGLMNLPGATEDFKRIQKSMLMPVNIRLRKLESSIPTKKEVVATQVGTATVTKSAGDTEVKVVNNGEVVATGKTEAQAREELNRIEEEKAKSREIKQEQISDLENKYNNGYFNPEWFDKNGKKKDGIKGNNSREKAELFARIAIDKTEAEVNEDIRKNVVIDRFSIDPENAGATLIYQPAPSRNVVQKKGNTGFLPFEKIIKSNTVDTHVISYMDGQNKVQLNSYKHPKTSLSFQNFTTLIHYLEKGGVEEPGRVATYLQNKSYYEFLQESVNDPTVYNQINGVFLQFKGTPQQQLDTIEELQKTWDAMSIATTEELRTNFVYERDFKGVDYGVVPYMDIQNLPYAFAQVRPAVGAVPVNQRVFYYIKDNFNNQQIDPANIRFIGLPEAFQQDAREKIVKSVKARHESQEIYGGFFMLVTDSNGSPVTHALTYKGLTAEDFYSHFKNNGMTNIAIVANNDTLKITYDDQQKRLRLDDLSDNSFTFVDYNITSQESVELLNTEIVNGLKKDKLWYKQTPNESEGESKQFKKVYPVDTIVTHLIEKSQYAPTTQAEILEYKQVTGIASDQYLTKKLTARLVTPMEKNGFDGIPQVVEQEQVVDTTDEDVETTHVRYNIPGADLANYLADKLNLVLPDFVNTKEINAFVENIDDLSVTHSDITRVILLAFQEQANSGDGKAFYLAEGMNLKFLENLAKRENTPENNTKITNALRTARTKGTLNMFTDRVPERNLDDQDELNNRIADLIKTCVR